jgi:hypothetical protein
LLRRASFAAGCRSATALRDSFRKKSPVYAVRGSIQ